MFLHRLTDSGRDASQAARLYAAVFAKFVHYNAKPITLLLRNFQQLCIELLQDQRALLALARMYTRPAMSM